MSNYPDWVNAFKVKGTSVKKVGNEYYLYKSTSKRVPGKKYPLAKLRFYAFYAIALRFYGLRLTCNLKSGIIAPYTT
ncbi:MAG: hypothetical protein LBL49_06395 [Clostridiales Family XIII bacterium]|nr:hypothetical protein [Clostridiales Family XIII bacterium]